MMPLRSTRRVRASASAAPHAGRVRAGMSLVEVLVAVSLLSISLLALARISPLLSQYGRRNDVQLNRAYVIQEQGDRLMALPYDSLKNVQTGTKTLTIQGQSWRRTITMTDSASMKKIVLIVKPLSTMPALQKPDTVVIWRAGGTSCVLNTNAC